MQRNFIVCFLLIAGSMSAAVAGPLRFAAAEMPKPDPCLPFIAQTANWLDRRLPDGAVFRYYKVGELARAVAKGEVDIVLSEAGVAARLQKEGARPLLTAVSLRHSSPASSQGSVFFVRDDRTDLTSVENLAGHTLGATAEEDFTGYQAAMGELDRRGFDPNKHFSDIRMSGSGSKVSMQHVVDQVLKGEVDVGVVRTCFLEDMKVFSGKELSLRVIEPYDDPKFACQRSTALYPNWTISSVPTLSAERLRDVVKVLFEMPKTPEGMFWSVAPDFSPTDRLMKVLKIGPYEFLRHWTVNRIWHEYSSAICIGILLVLGLFVHAWGSSVLVEKKTKELKRAFAEREELKGKNIAMERNLERFQRASIVGQISNIFAHEIKQPLHSAACYSHGLLRIIDMNKSDPDLLRSGLERIEDEIQQIGKVVDKVQEYARGHAPEMKILELNGIVKDVIARHVVHPGLSVTVVDDGQSAPFEGDELEIQLILINVVKNACEAALQANVPAVIVKCGRSNSGCDDFVIRVSDNGPAIKDETFFAMGVPLVTTKPTGLGLGLVIVKGLLERYRGTLGFERNELNGISAVITLPLSSVKHG